MWFDTSRNVLSPRPAEGHSPRDRETTDLSQALLKTEKKNRFQLLNRIFRRDRDTQRESGSHKVYRLLGMLALGLAIGTAGDNYGTQIEMVRQVVQNKSVPALEISETTTGEILGAQSKELKTTTPSWEKPSPTETPTPVPTVQPTEISQTEPSESSLEILFQNLQQLTREARRLRLGLLDTDAQRAGTELVSYTNPHTGEVENISVPIGTDPQFYEIYSPSNVARNLGILRPDGTIDSLRREKLLNDHRLTILICGLDTRPESIDSRGGGIGGRCDAPIVVSIDLRTMSVTLISTARDILPPVIAAFHPEQIPANQELSLMTGYTLHKDKHGNYIPSQTPLEFSRYVMEQALGIPIDGIQNFNFDAAAQILHALIPTGVDITLSTEVRDTDPTTFYYNVAPGTLHFPAGLNHLGAWDLINLMRARHGSSDLDRQDRQRQILMAVIQSVRNNLSETRLDQKLTFLAALDQNVSTSLTQFEQNAADASKPEFVPSPSTAYSQEYGISLHRLFDFLNKNLPTLAAAYTTKQLEVPQLSFQTISISPADTLSSNDQIEFWSPARAKIDTALDLSTVALESSTPPAVTAVETQAAATLAPDPVPPAVETSVPETETPTTEIVQYFEITTRQNVNLRSLPTTQKPSAVLSSLKKGTRVKMLDQEKLDSFTGYTYILIQTDDGKQGWIVKSSGNPVNP